MFPLRHNRVTLCYHRLKKLQGYRFGVLCCAVISAVVFTINLILTVWAVLSSEVQNGLGTLQNGSCKTTGTLTFWIHLINNILSTLLLGASNYSMQCLSSPTRSDIDKAHSQGIWMDIGVPSLRNLRRISTNRTVLWWLLAISSITLHLLYNSAVFPSLDTRQFNIFLVSEVLRWGSIRFVGWPRAATSKVDRSQHCGELSKADVISEAREQSMRGNVLCDNHLRLFRFTAGL